MVYKTKGQAFFFYIAVAHHCGKERSTGEKSGNWFPSTCFTVTMSGAISLNGWK